MSTTLERLVAMAEDMRSAAEDVAANKRALEAATERYKRLETVDLPELMREIGVPALTLPDGTALQLADDFSCGITEEKAPAALAWLRENGFGALIKSVVSAEFGRGEEERAQQASKLLQDNGFDPAAKETVHPQTLKSFIREQMEAGKPPPFDLFSIHVMAKAKLVQQPKKRR